MNLVQIRLKGPAEDVETAKQLIERALGDRVRIRAATTDHKDADVSLAYGTIAVPPAEGAAPPPAAARS